MRTIFVFGSNREGRHGKGAALEAMKRGAVYGQAIGLQGDSYGIVTKELRPSYPPVTLGDIKAGIDRFLSFARSRPDLSFVVTPIGCGLAGFDPDQIAPLFADAPDNVILPDVFRELLGPT